jgi:hypothetical protein
MDQVGRLAWLYHILVSGRVSASELLLFKSHQMKMGAGAYGTLHFDYIT